MATALQLTLPSMARNSHQPKFRSKFGPMCCAASERQMLFNRIAPIYDNMNDFFTLGQHRSWKRMTVAWTGAKEGDKVLDVCCGTGDLAFLLSEKVGPGGKVIAIDFSKELLAVAESRQKMQPNGCYKNIEWVEGDAVDMPFSDSDFDAATVGYGLRNIVDRRKAMEELYRVLKPGSRLSILDFNKSTHPLTISIMDFMIDNVIVPVATGYGLASEYAYLKNSIKEFLTGEELEKLALETGFSAAEYFEVSAGLMGNLVAIR